MSIVSPFERLDVLVDRERGGGPVRGGSPCRARRRQGRCSHQGRAGAVDDALGARGHRCCVARRRGLDRPPPGGHAPRRSRIVRPGRGSRARRRRLRAGPRADRARRGVRQGSWRRLSRAREGGHSTARVLHAGGTATGAEVERALVAAVRDSAAAILEDWFALDLVLEGGRCTGVVALDPSGELQRVEAAHVVLACGGRRADVRGHDQSRRGDRRRHRDGAARRGPGCRHGVRPVPPDRAPPCGHAAPAHLRGAPRSRGGAARRRGQSFRGRAPPARPREPGDRRQAGGGGQRARVAGRDGPRGLRAKVPDDRGVAGGGRVRPGP